MVRAWAVAFLMLIATIFVASFSAYIYVTSRSLEWQLIRIGYFPVSSAPARAELGDIFIIDEGGEVYVADPLGLCGFKGLNSIRDQRAYVKSSPLPSLVTESHFLDDLSVYLGRPLEELEEYPDPLIEDRTLLTASYVDLMDRENECTKRLADSHRRACFLFYASEISVAGTPVAFTTSLSCQLFDYASLSDVEVEKMTQQKNFGSFFGLTPLQLFSLRIRDTFFSQ